MSHGNISRVLVANTGHWFDELRAVAYYSERELEDWIHQQAKSLFQYHYVIPFKIDIASRTSATKKRADLALIRHDFDEWIVVEVELETHQLNHVLEQIEVFKDGEYNIPQTAEHVQTQLKRFCRKQVGIKRLEKLMLSKNPEVLVIADSLSEQWRATLERAGVQFCSFEIYKNTSSDHIFRVFGEYPVVPVADVHCRSARVPNTIEIVGAFSFTKLSRSHEIDITFNATLSRWSYFKDKGRQYLRFEGKSNPLSPQKTYVLYRDKSDKYFFKLN